MQGKEDSAADTSIEDHPAIVDLRKRVAALEKDAGSPEGESAAEHDDAVDPEMTANDLIAQMSPETASKIIQEIVDRVTKQITDKWAQGMVDNDVDCVKAAQAQLKAWNAENPDLQITVKPQDVARRKRELASADA